MAKTFFIKKKTKGNCDIIDITEDIEEIINNSEEVNEGIANIFVIGSTAAITTIEYEPGLKKDMEEFFKRIIPKNIKYSHEKKWHDDNGHSHIRASLLKPNISIPIVGNNLKLGTWQQIILVDFDTCGREREIIVSLLD